MLDNAELIRRAKAVNVVLKNREPSITVQEVADILGISKNAAYNTMWKWQKEGIVKYVAQAGGYGDWYWIGLK